MKKKKPKERKKKIDNKPTKDVKLGNSFPRKIKGCR
jgi:hypothetical protein